MKRLRDWKALMIPNTWFLVHHHAWGLQFIYIIQEVTPKQVVFKREGHRGAVFYDHPKAKEVSFGNGAMTINRDGIPFVSFYHI